MLIAEVEGKRCKATKGAKGICPYCKSEVIAKCGEQKVAHWAHKANKECDSWHDKETEWHLMWKNYFPESWQEIIKYDPTKTYCRCMYRKRIYIRISTFSNKARGTAITRKFL